MKLSVERPPRLGPTLGSAIATNRRFCSGDSAAAPRRTRFNLDPRKGTIINYQTSQRILHILLVEDHDDTRRGMELFLRAHGHRTQVAAGVQEALDLAATFDTRFDLLLSDLQLPDGNGWDLLRRLEEGGWRPQQAVAVSGWGSDMDVAKSKSAGFRTHLVKPITPQVLEAVLAQVAEVTAKKSR